jgi:ribosomal protein L14E/L6E/L27E
MITDTVYDTLENELCRQTKILQETQAALENAPEGYLYIRDTGKGQSYYRVMKKSGEKTKHIKINDRHLIGRLLKKTRNKAIIKVCKNNLAVLKRAMKEYQPLVLENLLSEKQKNLLIELHKEEFMKPYKKARFDPCYHIHETMCGEWVRSKAEVIIANALWHYGIPFNYEEMFPCPDDEGNWFYPDFTVHCPDGTTIIWEHWGMLDKMTYCMHNTGKLHTYNENNYVIGKNLIITQDDAAGNCSTRLIYHIIENYIKPHFQ